MHSNQKNNRLPRLVITAGESAGIGPDLCLMMAANQSGLAKPVQLVVAADPELLAQRAQTLGLTVELKTFHPDSYEPAGPNQLLVTPVSMAAPAEPGVLNPANSQYVLDTLTLAVDGCSDGLFDGMVTGPVNKEIINDAGVPFSGHTEFLAERTGTQKVVMMLATEGLRVALATTHLPLAKVPAAITQDSLEQVIRILDHDLKNKFGIASPRVLVCGLNPHAGEGGHLGMEEIETIIPVLEKLRSEGLNLTGPLPADTLFNPSNLETTDAVLVMYHDQGLPVLKYKGFGHGVNITLGLPIIRTSVDHGTALDRAGTGQISLGSLYTAIHSALEMMG